MRDTPTANRRWFRFSLRTLLIVVTMAGVVSWAYWIGWPWWRTYREQREFERGIATLHAGMTDGEIINSCPWGLPGFWGGATYAVSANDPESDVVLWDEFLWPNYMYLVCTRSAYRTGVYTNPNHCISVEVFRLPRVRDDYQPESAQGRKMVSDRRPGEFNFVNTAYVYDFLEFIYGDRKNNPSFDYKLIYADPPPKPDANLTQTSLH
jgi:hypothetical protein